MRNGIRNQASCWRVEVTWSRRPIFVMRRAAAFWTRWSGATVDYGRPASTTLQWSKRLVTKAVMRLVVISWPSIRRTCFNLRIWKKQLLHGHYLCAVPWIIPCPVTHQSHEPHSPVEWRHCRLAAPGPRSSCSSGWRPSRTRSLRSF